MSGGCAGVPLLDAVRIPSPVVCIEPFDEHADARTPKTPLNPTPCAVVVEPWAAECSPSGPYTIYRAGPAVRFQARVCPRFC